MPAWAILAVDLVCVIAFAIVGRASHGGVRGLADVANVGWPFLVALGVGWMIVGGVRRRAPRDLGAGAIVFAVTLAGGMLLRGATGGGTAAPFLIVASIFLALTLLGWRLLAMRPLR